MDHIQDKVVVITGASSGIGESTARLLAEKGARLVLAARRVDRLSSLVSDIEAAGGTAMAVQTDVSKREDVEALIAASHEAYGHIDVLINNAGIMPVAPMEMARIDDWDKMIDVNVKGLLYGIGAALPHMKERKQGHIINIASVAGHKFSQTSPCIVRPSMLCVRFQKDSVWRARKSAQRSFHPD